MIEAVNSVVSNASVSRGVAEQQSAARSYASNPEKTQEATSQTPYISQHIKVDSTYNKAVLQIRDSDTGDVVRQFPTEGQLKAYRTAQEFVDRAEQLKSDESPTPALGGGDAPEVQAAEAPQTSAPAPAQTESVSTEA